MSINCIILDDEQHCLDTLSHHVSRTPSLQLIMATTDPAATLHAINTQHIHLLFLDVQMPDVSGIDLAHTIGNKCKIVLTTAYEQYAVKGYDLAIADFLLKPISFTRFLKAVQKVQELLTPVSREGETFIYVKTGARNNIMQIGLETIDYIEGTGNYVEIHHEGKKTGIYQSLKELEFRLPTSRFIRVSRSCIVPYAKIKKAEGGYIVLKGIDKQIMLGDTYKTIFWEKIRSRTL